MSERPKGIVRVANIEAAVWERKDWRSDGVPDEVVKALVWEILEVLKEWGFIGLEVPEGRTT